MEKLDFIHDIIDANGIKIHTVTLNGNNPDVEPIPILLVHGFPECWYSWRYLMPLLANPANGKPHKAYKVVAIDTRGYNLSSKPKWVKNYRLPTLVKDLVEVIKKITDPSNPKVYLVGHDWGGALSWELTRYYPQHVEKLFVLNCPPVEVLFQGLVKVPGQILSSYYIFFFQIPFLPERLFAHKRYTLIRKMYQHIRGPDGNRLTKDEVNYYVKAFNRPRGISGINFYRSSLRDLVSGRIPLNPPKIKKFVKVIWGARDLALNVGLTRMLREKVQRGKLRIKYIPKGTHHVQQNFPVQCAEEILKHL